MVRLLAVLMAPLVVALHDGSDGDSSGGPGGDDGSVMSICSACGGDATYSESISTDSDSGYDKRVVSASGCPNHYSVCTGKLQDGIQSCGAIGGEGDSTEARPMDQEFTIPANPVLATSTYDIECDPGAIGIALNGIVFYTGWVSGTCDILDVEDSSGEWISFDFCSGHADGQSGEYHYHFPPSCLLDQIITEEGMNKTGEHSPQVGWAFDGFPIYGPRGVGGKKMKYCTNWDDGDDYDDDYLSDTHCLDMCGGREEELSSIDNFKYRYYTTGSESDLATLPSTPMPETDEYPFIYKCYRGCTWDQMTGDTDDDGGRCSGGSNGYTSSYSASELDGYTTQYTPDEATDWACYDDDDYGNMGDDVSGAASAFRGIALALGTAAAVFAWLA